MVQTASDSLNKIYQELKNIKRYVKVLYSLMISLMGKDEEGDYRPEFVREIIKASKEKPTHTFKNAKEFLSRLRRL